MAALVREVEKKVKRAPDSSLIQNIVQKTEKNKTLVRQYLDLFNQHNLDKVKELISPKHRFYLPNMEPMDWNQHMQLLSSVYYTAFPDLQIEIKEEDMIAGCNLISVPVKCTGTFDEEFQGIPPTREKVSFGALWIQDFDTNDRKESMLAEEWIIFNRVEVLQNLKPVPR
jgi:predicted ester cyclase